VESDAKGPQAAATAPKPNVGLNLRISEANSLWYREAWQKSSPSPKPLSISTMTPKQIIKLREALGFTQQQQLADTIGAQQPAVARWETGKNKPRGANLKALRELQKKPKVLEAKAKIFERLCQYHKDGNKNAYVDSEIVKKDKAIPEAIFAKALDEFRSEGYTRVEVEHPSGRLRLGANGLRSCESKLNPYR
jgi:DNA-binding transcriptional regulator YiaG